MDMLTALLQQPQAVGQAPPGSQPASQKKTPGSADSQEAAAFSAELMALATRSWPPAPTRSPGQAPSAGAELAPASGAPPAVEEDPDSRPTQDRGSAFSQNFSDGIALALSAQAGSKTGGALVAQGVVKAASASSGSGSASSADGPDFLKKRDLTRDSRSPQMESGGTKPWSKDWVFEGGSDQNPMLRPLLDKSEIEKLIAARMALMTAARGRAESLSPYQGQIAQVNAAAQAMGGQAARKAEEAQAGEAQPRGANQAFSASASASPLAALAAQLELLGGEIEEPSPQTASVGANGPKPATPSKVSGSEFLDTLSSVRPPAAPKLPLASAGSDWQGARPRSVAGDEPVAVRGSKRGLDELAQGPDVPAAALAHLRPERPERLEVAGAGRELVADVVPGRMARDRLTHEALSKVTAEVRTLASRGGGEMRLRLNPDNLGELRVMISTQGNSVGIKFVASDDRARRVIEESAVHLRESLGAQNLSVGRLDIVTSQADGQQIPGHSQQGQDRPLSDGEQSPSQHSALPRWMSDQQGGRDRGREWSASDEGGDGPVRLRPSAMASSAASRGRSAAVAGRLDVMA